VPAVITPLPPLPASASDTLARRGWAASSLREEGCTEGSFGEARVERGDGGSEAPKRCARSEADQGFLE
jgi:hypothetical protein